MCISPFLQKEAGIYYIWKLNYIKVTRQRYELIGLNYYFEGGSQLYVIICEHVQV